MKTNTEEDVPLTQLMITHFMNIKFKRMLFKENIQVLMNIEEM